MPIVTAGKQRVGAAAIAFLPDSLDGERLGKVTETFNAQRPGLARSEGAEGAQQSGELGLQDNSLR